MRVRVLGPADVDGVPLPLRERQVLGVLVVRRSSTATLADFGEAIWRGTPPPTARKVIQGCVVRLRRVLGEGSIVTVDGGYRLTLTVPVDAADFEDLCAQAVTQLRDGYAERCVDVLRRALKLWRGLPFSELEDWPPAETETARLTVVRESAIDLRLVALHDAGRFVQAADEGAAAAAATPYREARWAAWARSLYSAGRSADALEALAMLRRTLADDLGVDPTPEITDLERAILRHDPHLNVAIAVSTGSHCPWPGLLPYESGDAGLFFGRDDDIQAVTQRLGIPRSRLVLTGASGSGKSSLLRAGVVSAFMAAGKTSAVFTPGPHPVDELRALPPCDLIIVDQVEQLVTQNVTTDDAALFFEALVVLPGAVVVAVRADMLDALCAFRGFVEILQMGLLVLRPLDEAGLRSVIEGPAEASNLRMEPGLTELILSECHGDPSILPLVSHVLAETWKRVEGNTLTVAGYQSSGGLVQAVATSAETLYASLDHSQRRNMRSLFRRLVVDDVELVRGRASSDAAPPDLVEMLLAARLLSVTDDGDLQLAHEALITRWPRLLAWIGDDREGRRLLRNLAHDAREWSRSGEPASSLYRGVRLAAAAEWAQDHHDEITELERRFLKRSSDSAEGDLRRTRRDNRRLRIAVGAAAVLVVATLAGAALAIQSRADAQDARRAAEDALAYSEALRIGGLAEANRDPAVAFDLTAEALSLDDSADTREVALEVFARFSDLLADTELPTGWPPDEIDAIDRSPATSADGTLTAEADGFRVTIRDTEQALPRVIDGIPTTPTALAFNPSGTRLAGALNDEGFADVGTTIVWDVATGVEIARFVSGGGPIFVHQFDADGTTLFTYGVDGVHAWDLTESRAVVRLQSGAPTMFRTPGLTLSVWDSSVDEWMTQACALAGRSLTPAEWERLVGDDAYEPVC